MLQNTPITYGTVAKTLHWLMAFLVIVLYSVAYKMMSMEASDQKWTLYGLHKATGLVMFILVVLRFTWRATQPQPSLPFDMPDWQQQIAKGNYILLYLLMMGMPLTGLTMSLMGGKGLSFYGLFNIQPIADKHPIAGIAHEAHWILSYILIAAVGGHTGGALYHHFIRKDNVLRRMLPGNNL